MEQKIIVTDVNGNDVECSIIAKWSENGNNYLALTKGSQNGNQEKLLVAKCSVENGKIKLKKITDDAEWVRVNEFLNKTVFKGEK